MLKKILIISFTPSHPQSSGTRLRVLNLTEILREIGYDVHFLHVAGEDGDKSMMQNYWGDRFHSFHCSSPTPGKSFWAKTKKEALSLLNLSSAYLGGIDDWYDPSLDDFLNELKAGISFDVVITIRVFLSKALLNFKPDVFKVIDAIDAFVNRHQLFLKQKEKPQWFSTTAKEEKKGLNRADLVIAIDESDKRYFSSLIKTTISMVSYWTPLKPPQPRVSGRNNILFVGSASHANANGVRYFLRDIFPRIQKAIPDTRFLLAGKIKEMVVLEPCCYALGWVENLKEVYAQADVVVSPILFGTGLKIKSIEALGYSMPLVATDAGAKGLKGGADRAFLLANSPEVFANQVIKILSDDSLHKRLSEEAYRFSVEWNNQHLAEFRRLFSEKSKEVVL